MCHLKFWLALRSQQSLCAVYDPMLVQTCCAGGRSSTRYASGFQFDHGCSFIVPRSQIIKDLLHTIKDAGMPLCFARIHANCLLCMLLRFVDFGTSRPETGPNHTGACQGICATELKGCPTF